jgi:hypothetical protein
MYLTPGKTLAFQRRHAFGGSTFATLGSSTAIAPVWMRLDRVADTFTAYASIDGSSWSFVGSDTVEMDQPTVYIGLAVASANTQKTSLATFDNVTVTPGTPTPPTAPPDPALLPDGWNDLDVGNVGFTGGASSAASAFSIKGAGGDIWGAADAFNYAYRVISGDGFIIARVKSLQNTSSSAKAGVMIRETLDAGSSNAVMLVTPTKGSAFDRRVTTGAATVATAGPLTASGALVKAPYWVKLERIGSTFNAYQSPDGVDWTLVSSETIEMAPTVYVGLAVTSHNQLATTTAVFDNVTGSW